MESPSAQLLPPLDDSIMHFDADGPPSSPFMTNIESRAASKQFEAQSLDDSTLDVFITPARSHTQRLSLDEMEGDKENVPQASTTTPQKPIASSPAPRTPEQEPFALKSGTAPVTEQRRKSKDSDLMPPPSTRKTPAKSPLKPSQSVASASRPNTSRHHSSHSTGSIERVETHSSSYTSTSSFQTGLDMRALDMQPQDTSSLDDTCFSAFSAIPDMTTFAKLGQSPTKQGDVFQTPGRKDVDATPRNSRKRPSPSRSPSPTPRRHKASAHRDSTTFLIDFTQQMEGISGYRSPNKSTTQPDLLKYMHDQRSPHKSSRQSYATPAKQNNILNLLDFELPPAPTPRSVPTITVRELESLKSSYLSQISSLKATLSGREAEVESLKRAVGDAERRVGEAQEARREEKNRREYAEQEKVGWEKRGQEVENVLKSVKEEVIKGEAEKEELAKQMDDCERRAEDAESRAMKAEERFAEALASRVGSGDCEGDSAALEEQVQRLVAAQIDAKIEAVSRELHAVYKEKHERKVSTLKKSYEARSEKKCADLQTRLTELEKQNEELISAKDATFSGPVPDTANMEVEVELKSQIEEQKAHLARLENEMHTSQHQQEQLMQELEKERIEKGDLVAAVDEMLALQSEQGPTQVALSVVEDFRKSISRPSGLRTPAGIAGPNESKIGRGPLGHSKTKSLGGGLRGGLERMGRTGGGAPAE